MKRIILIFILLLILFSVMGISCEKQPTLNCEQACKHANYKEGECKQVPVIEKPCSIYEEVTLFDFECKQKPPKDIVGIGFACCCREK